MRVARFTTGTEPRYGVVELAEDQGTHPETITVLNGDPLAGPVKTTGERVPLSEARLLSPVIPRSKVIGVGKNFLANEADRAATDPGVPILFIKPNTCVISPGDPILKPAESEGLNYEGELAAVIGRICRRVPAERVGEVIFGYTIANDVTARDFLFGDPQWTRAKAYDTFCPLGPWISTHLSVEEASDLEITTKINGEIRQQGSTSLMIRGIAELISYISAFTTLLPGDVILTGTPAGIGPMEPGDNAEISIAQIGTLSNPVKDE